MTKQELLQKAQDAFGTQPEYLWARTPEFAVLRRSDNKKWYALVMTLPRRTLKLAGEGSVDAVNLKCDPLLIGSLRLSPGYLPAYHMSKAHWITVLLDGSVPEDQILDLLAASYHLAGGIADQKSKRGGEHHAEHSVHQQ